VAEKSKNLFTRLTKLFRVGPTVRKKVPNSPSQMSSSAKELFQRNVSDVYASTISAYGSFDRMSRYSDFSEMEACIAGDTLIATPDGYVEIQELAKKYGADETFIVYSYDHEKSQIVPALGKQARKTVTEMSFKVTFDSGKFLIATPDHRVMKRDGTYCEVQNLKIGDSMMPFYRRDFLSKNKENSDGYQWIYTMDYENSSMKNGWVSEHRLIASWVANRKLENDEVVHHKNFKKNDNRPENLQIMNEKDHHVYHAKILNEKKWDYESNSEWIESFKKKHSEFMKKNNPAKRNDIDFARILYVCDRDGFNLYELSRTLDCDIGLIYRRLQENGFNSFTTFAKAYDPNWKNNGWNNKGENNPRHDKTLTFQKICDQFNGQSLNEFIEELGATRAKILNRLKTNGFKNWNSFADNFHNHKVVSIEPYGVIDLYDLTVDGYKNYATDSIIVHNTPEISSALDIYSEEATSQDENGKILHIYSDNRIIRELLENLFYDVLNVDFNLPMWTRNLCKYGDLFLFNDVDPEYGIVNVFPIPVAEIEREEGFDPENPMAVRYRWITKGNAILENWQITHFRLLGNDAFLPYGSSVLESARRIWRQLILIEDAMLVYRIVRAPERRIFYIDIGNIAPDEIENYMQQQQTSLKRNKAIDRVSGKVDLRYNPLSVDDDYYIPVRGGETGTRIDTLAGGQNTAAIEDVQYIQKKLFAALKIPKAYLGYDEDIGAKATLAQEDIRFSRTIARTQKVLISELNKLAIIHLYSHGFQDDDVLNFKIFLNNPSSVAQLQKLELIKTKFDIASAAPEGSVDREWIRKNILGLTNEEIALIKEGRKNDKLEDEEIEQTTLQAPEGEEDTGGDETGFEEETPAEDEEGAEDLFAADIQDGEILGEIDSDEQVFDLSKLPLKVSAEAKGVFGGKKKRKRKRASNEKAQVPDFLTIVNDKRSQSTSNNPYGLNLKSVFENGNIENEIISDSFYSDRYLQTRKTAETDSMLSSLMKIKQNKVSIIFENKDADEMLGDDGETQ